MQRLAAFDDALTAGHSRVLQALAFPGTALAFTGRMQVFANLLGVRSPGNRCTRPHARGWAGILEVDAVPSIHTWGARSGSPG
jgi:hypothetical protein